MDEATLTIRFKDESSPGGSGVAQTSPQYSGSDPGSVKVADQQNAITQAGGVGAMAAKNSQANAGATPAAVPPGAAQPVPPASVAATPDPLASTVRQIVQADPTVNATELAATLGIKQREAEKLLNAATVQPGGQQPQQAQPQPQPTPPGTGQPVPPASNPLPPVQPSPGGTQPPTPPPAPPPVQGQTPPPVPPPIQTQQPQAPNAAGAQAAVNAIAGIAAQGGPLVAAAGRLATTTAAVPGVGSGLAAAAPAFAAAAPYLAVGAAALAVPATGALVLNSIANTARGQIAGLSPEVASAEAQASIRQLLANFRTANRLGDEVADNIAASSRLGAASQGVRDVTLEPLLREFVDAKNGLARAVEGIDSFAQKQPQLIQTIVMSQFDNILTGLGIPGLIFRLSAWLGKEEKKENAASTLGAIIPKRPALPAEYGFTESSERYINNPKPSDFSGGPGLSL